MNLDDGEENIKRSFRDLGPAHCVFKIENFSLLRNAEKSNFESSDFEVDGYKWRLSLYPNGHTKMKWNRHISLYLAFSESNSISPGQDVHVYCKFFVYNFIKDKYLMIQDGKGELRRFIGRFHGIRREWGFDKLFPLRTFNDPSKGYLVDDCCIFGAEVSVLKPTNKAECMSVMKFAADGTFTWSIDKFSLFQNVYCSDVFVVGKQGWKLSVYPRGSGEQKGKSLSVFLEWVDEPGSLVRKVFAQYTLLVKDELHGKHLSRKVSFEFGPSVKSWGFAKFLSLDDLNSQSKGFKVNDTVVVEVQIHLMSVFTDF